MTDTERIACRILVGDTGQRVQGFLTRLGLDHSYVLFNAFPYVALRAAALARICRSVSAPFPAPARISLSPCPESQSVSKPAPVTAYHEARLSELVTHVAGVIDRFRAGELDAFGVDSVLFQYSRAAKELWKFCNTTDVEMTAQFVRDKPPIDWWERGAPKKR